MDAGEVILWAAIFGLLIGIIWSLKYIVIIDRRIERIEKNIASALRKKRKTRKKRKKRKRKKK
ncbi:hypothetical protein GF374_01135 [Candidatus Woesearchaeota archaeon]|nr:hypothetical protein [Candidatus Woesearchaeota archaeon]